MRYLLLLAFLLLISCNQKNPNLNKSGKDELQSLELDQNIKLDKIKYQDKLYVPIYSDIYIDKQNPKQLLSATLSIRNTSSKDSIFISKINYYNTNGNLVKKFINNLISIPPMATINYVIEEDDDTGGNGANFIVELSSFSKNTKPLIQAIMIGQYSNKSFAFKTDAYSLNE
ncbi:DUF3124 domain-containing protein [Pseudofulvibacter geojedonensis]|uniref:DUF3124 domain-containing protein n=1 Tax=Pseudofulvibacter geojedonensis TaxID=1123758 RepID=A0ABW3I1T0_9FLAO